MFQLIADLAKKHSSSLYLDTADDFDDEDTTKLISPGDCEDKLTNVLPSGNCFDKETTTLSPGDCWNDVPATSAACNSPVSALDHKRPQESDLPSPQESDLPSPPLKRVRHNIDISATTKLNASDIYVLTTDALDVSAPKAKLDMSDIDCGLTTTKGFDPSQVTVDENCRECKLKYIDPKPENLVMYLHAFKYKVLIALSVALFIGMFIQHILSTFSKFSYA